MNQIVSKTLDSSVSIALHVYTNNKGTQRYIVSLTQELPKNRNPSLQQTGKIGDKVEDVWSAFDRARNEASFPQIDSLDIGDNGVDPNFTAYVIRTRNSWKKISTVPLKGDAAQALAETHEIKALIIRGGESITDAFLETLCSLTAGVITDYLFTLSKDLNERQWDRILAGPCQLPQYKFSGAEPSQAILHKLKARGVNVKDRPEELSNLVARLSLSSDPSVQEEFNKLKRMVSAFTILLHSPKPEYKDKSEQK